MSNFLIPLKNILFLGIIRYYEYFKFYLLFIEVQKLKSIQLFTLLSIIFYLSTNIPINS